MPVIRIVVVGVVLLVGSWALLVVLARRLPPGTLKDVPAFLPTCVTVARRLRCDPRVPRRAKVALGFAAPWVLRYAARQIPRALLFEAWPAEPRLLDRLLRPRHLEGVRGAA